MKLLYIASATLGSVLGWLLWEICQTDLNQYCTVNTTPWLDAPYRYRGTILNNRYDHILMELQFQEQERCLQEALLVVFFMMMAVTLSIIWISYVLNKRFQENIENQLIQHINAINNTYGVLDRRRG